MFTKKQLYKLIIPLIIEQLLAVTVGMANIMMVSRAGEAAISGVSLVDTINVLLITLFSSLATGGAVVAAQYLGHKEKEKACKAADQLVLITTLIAVIIMVIALLGNKIILKSIYGNIDSVIMNNAMTYFYITALSFPFLAIYNSCAALFRAMGNSTVSMVASLIMNVVNIALSAILVMGFHMEVTGVAIPALVARIVAAMIMLYIIRNRDNLISISKNILRLGFDKDMIKRILHIGVPNGLENSIFQIGKILVMGLTTSFGEIAIASNSVAGTIAGLELIPGSALGIAMITVVGQCIGAGDVEQAKKYTVKLMKLTYIIMISLNIIILLFRVPLIGLYNLSSETTAVTLQLVTYHTICCCIIWPFSFALPNALRASNDVKFTMIVSILSMWIWRIGFSYVLASYFELGVLGVWIAMTIDWLVRGICFGTRFFGGKWKKHAYIR
ncbi:MAG: MATE family efflux transporter [Anaerocolumna sp.]